MRAFSRLIVALAALALAGCDGFFPSEEDDPIKMACQSLTYIHPDWDKYRREREMKRCVSLGPASYEESTKPFDPLAQSAEEKKLEKSAIQLCKDAVKAEQPKTYTPEFKPEPYVSTLDGKIFVKGKAHLMGGGEIPMPHKYICTVMDNTLIDYLAMPERRKTN